MSRSKNHHARRTCCRCGIRNTTRIPEGFDYVCVECKADTFWMKRARLKLWNGQAA